MMEVLTLVQTGKVKREIPIILYGSKYWHEVINFDAMVSHGVIDEKDLSLFRFADTPEQAFQLLKADLSAKIPRTVGQNTPIEKMHKAR
jgi:predicted Rossmann-fold nucleotide-binding protein